MLPSWIYEIEGTIDYYLLLKPLIRPITPEHTLQLPLVDPQLQNGIALSGGLKLLQLD